MTALVILVDQVVKLIIKTTMGACARPPEVGYDEWFNCNQVNILGDTLKIHYTENPGAAFGLKFSNIFEMSDFTAKIILTLFSFFAIFAIFYFLRRSMKYKSALPLLIALILGGAIGNVIDRMFYGMIFENDYEGGFLFGRVVDMFYVDLGTWTMPDWLPLFGGDSYDMFPIFNVADSAISVGIVSIILFQKRLFAEEPKPTPKDSGTDATKPVAEDSTTEKTEPEESPAETV